MNALRQKQLIALSFVSSLLAASITTQQTIASTSTFPTSPGVITIAQGKEFQASNNQRQHFTDSINLAPGQEKLPLTLTYFNGDQTHPGFQWLRINSSTMSYLTEKQFNGKSSLSVPVRGGLASGGNQIIVDAGGLPGATFDWKLTAPAPEVTGVSNANVTPGSTITVTGKNFSTAIASNTAQIASNTLKCVTATPTALTLQIPQGLQATKGTVSVTTAGLNAGAASIEIKHSVPSLSRLSASQVAPGCEMTIYGGPFANNIDQLKVTIGQFDAQIVSATANSIQVIAPMGFAGAPWGVNQPVTVWSNGVQARNSLSINCYTGTVGGGYVSVN